MAVMAAFCYLEVRGSGRPVVKALWVVVTVLEGYSRIVLNYHTLEQVIAGTVYGITYAIVFSKLWSNWVGPWLSEHYMRWARVQAIPDSEDG
jgi:membrane-associated phospholipid phosphatase